MAWEVTKLLAQVFLERSIIFQLAEEFYVVMKPYVSWLSPITAVLQCFHLTPENMSIKWR